MLNRMSYFICIIGTGLLFNTGSLSAETGSSLAIEEVIVTALKREESLQDTPVSVTAFSAGDLESRSMANIGEIGNYTPNLSFGTTGIGSGDSARVHMRGIGQTDFIITTDPGVGMYVDGAYLSRSFGSLFGLLDVERIEVLRGPQGTLYGKNTIGGAINVISAKPHGEFEGYAKVTTGSFDRLDGKVAVNLPLVKDRLFARVSAMSTNNDGYATNLFDGSDLSDDETVAARAALRWLATDNLELELAIDAARKRAASENSKLVAVDPNGALFFPINLFIGQLDASRILADPYTTNGEFSGPANVNDLDVFGTTFTATWDINEHLSLKSITSYREVKTLFGADQDGTPLAIAHTLDDVDNEQVSQEFQFSGISFDNRLNWIAGLYFINEQGEEFNNVDLVPGLFPIIGVDVSIDVINETDNTSYALFGHGSYDLTEQLSLSAGLRYTYETKEYFAHHVNPNSMFTVFNETVDESWDSFSPKFGLEYRWTEDLMTYASVSRGFKSGGFNGRPLPNSPGLESFDPEIVWSYEIGFKSQFFNDRIRFNMSAFYNDYTDIQVTLLALTDANGNLLISVRNAAAAEIVGFESELTWRVSEAFDLSAGLGFTDASYDTFQDGPVDRSDSDFPFTPKWTFNVTGDYTTPLGDLGTLILHADYSYRSQQFLDTVNSTALDQQAYGLLNLRLAYETPDETFTLALFGKNLSDKVYMTNGVDASTFFGVSFASFAPPRTWGLEAQYRF